MSDRDPAAAKPNGSARTQGHGYYGQEEEEKKSESAQDERRAEHSSNRSVDRIGGLRDLLTVEQVAEEQEREPS